MNQENFWVLLSKKLFGEASDAELKELENLIHRHSEWQYAIQNLEDFWKQHPPKDEMQAQDAYMLHLHRIREMDISFEELPIKMPVIAGQKRIKKWYWMGAAVLVLAFGLFVFGHFFNAENEKDQPTEHLNEISTRKGSKSKVQLPDGSVVWLNAGSQLDYGIDFGNTNREVHLSGEGFFDVVKNPDKPFIIHTQAFDVKVLGTQFNVKSYPADKTTETSLIRGSVEVFVKNRIGKMVLKPNEKLVVYNDPVINNSNSQKETEKAPLIAIRQLTYQNNDTVAVETSWTQNKLSFKNELFADLARKMERWYDVTFEFDNKNKENLLMYGTFTTETLREALEALVFSFGFKYRIENKKVIIY